MSTHKCFLGFFHQLNKWLVSICDRVSGYSFLDPFAKTYGSATAPLVNFRRGIGRKGISVCRILSSVCQNQMHNCSERTHVLHDRFAVCSARMQSIFSVILFMDPKFSFRRVECSFDNAAKNFATKSGHFQPQVTRIL